MGHAEFQASGVSTPQDDCTEHKSCDIWKPEQSLSKPLVVSTEPTPFQDRKQDALPGKSPILEKKLPSGRDGKVSAQKP